MGSGAVSISKQKRPAPSSEESIKHLTRKVYNPSAFRSYGRGGRGPLLPVMRNLIPLDFWWMNQAMEITWGCHDETNRLHLRMWLNKIQCLNAVLVAYRSKSLPIWIFWKCRRCVSPCTQMFFPTKLFRIRTLLILSSAGQFGRGAASDQTAAVRASKLRGAKIFVDSIDFIDTLMQNS